MSGALHLVANARLPSSRAQAVQVLHAAAAFARQGERTTLVCARRRRTEPLPEGADLFDHYGVPPGPRPRVERASCIDLIDVVPRALQYVPARVQELTFARSAARLAREAGPDVTVLSREIETGLQLVRRGHRGVFLEIHRVPGGLRRRRWLLEAAHGALGTIAISGGVREDLVVLGLDPARLLVEHDALEPRAFAEVPPRAEARRALGLPESGPVVVYTGGLLQWKGVDVLVEAARGMRDVRFVVAGGMPADVARVRALATGLDHVRIDGFQPPARVPLYLAAADVGVVPNRSSPEISARYTSPLKVFEAMALGVPLVVSDLPSLRELLTDGEDAVFVAPDEPGALAAGIRRLLDDAGLRIRIGERLRGRAAEHTWDARAERLLEWMRAMGRAA